MRARLSWRLLVVPRLVFAFGVIVWAFVDVLLAPRRSQPGRLPPTGEDPVGEALAGAQPVPRFAGEELAVDDLRWIVSVDELAVDGGDGYNTVVGLDDTVSSYVDAAADGLADALADQPGIDAVEHPDREALLVRSVLSLPDVHAAAVRALLAVNRNPRRTPRRRSLPPDVMSAVADGVATLMGDRGFVRRLPGHEFHRVLAGERLIQMVALRDGVGYHNDDGTIVDTGLRLTVEVAEVATNDAVGERILSASYDCAPATVDGVAHALVSTALPLCECTTSRAAIVDRWVRGLPWHVPDRPRREAADIAARWGFRAHARDLSKHGR